MKHLQNVGLINSKGAPKLGDHQNKKQEFYTKLHTSMDWNASSRTDRGVHAISNFFSCKLSSEDSSKNFDWKKELNNSFSSQDDPLCVFHMDFMSDHVDDFDCRKFGLWRTYEYFIPQYCLKAMMYAARDNSTSQKYTKQRPSTPPVLLPSINLDQVCKSFNAVLSKMEGYRNFQNFTSATSSGTVNTSDSKQGQLDEGDEQENLQIKDTGNYLHRTVLQCVAKPHSLPVPHHKLYSASPSAAPIPTTETLQGIMIRVTASGFLYHQIRKMIGLALSHWIYPKDIDEEFVDISIYSKERMFIPTAPGDSLVLTHTTIKDTSMERAIFPNSATTRPEFLDTCINKDMEHFRTNVVHPHILLDTSASYKHIQQYLAKVTNSSMEKASSTMQKSSWIQLAHELRFHLKDLIDQKNTVRPRARKQIEELKRKEEWKKKDEREIRANTLSSSNSDLLPSGYKIHFYVTFKCLPHEERSINALNSLEALVRSGKIAIEENNFEIFDKFVRDKSLLKEVRGK